MQSAWPAAGTRQCGWGEPANGQLLAILQCLSPYASTRSLSTSNWPTTSRLAEFEVFRGERRTARITVAEIN